MRDLQLIEQREILKMDIVAVGECTIDWYSAIKSFAVAGISLNFAVQSKRCGANRASLVSCIGDDPDGTVILSKLDKEGVDRSHVHVRSGATATQDVVVDQNGESWFGEGCYHPGVLEGWFLGDEDLDFIASHDVLHVSYFDPFVPLFSLMCTDLGRPIRRVADLQGISNVAKAAEHLQMIDILFVNGNEELARQLTSPSMNLHNTIIVVSMGSAGSMALRRGMSYYQPAIRVPMVIDTTGCGDTFQAAFTVSYFSSGDIQTALERGAVQASKVIGHFGSTEPATRTA